MALRALQGPTGGGSPVGGSGTSSPSTIPRWTGPSTLGDSVIAQSGSNIGVGEPSPSGRLQVQGLSGNNTITAIGSTTAGQSYGIFVQAGTNASDRSFGVYSTGLSPYLFVRGDGNVGIGTASPVSRLDVAGTITCDDAGTGLKLPATPGNTDPNTLDCYADGGTANSGGVTWTPELRFGGATTGITYTTRVGRYTRVGNMIFATCYIALSSKGSATGAATIAGLPTSSNTSGLFSSGSIGYNVGVTYTNMLLVRMNANASAATLTDSSAAGALANVTDANFTNTSELVFSIAYPVT